MYYIGQTRVSLTKRDWEHRHNKNPKCSYFDNAYKKHPEDFTLKIIFEVNVNSKKLLVSILNIMEITYISMYKHRGRNLYNILKGGNVGWQDIVPTYKMIETLNAGRQKYNELQKQLAMSSEEKALSHKISDKKYRENNPEKYKKTYTEQNAKRKEYKKQWYLKNKDLCIERAREHYKLKCSQKPS